MRRTRLLPLLLIIVLIFGNAVYAQDNGTAKYEPITLSMLCNTSDSNHISGLYRNNTFFVTLNDLCEIIGGEITSNSVEYPIIKTSNGMRKISINTNSSHLEEEFYAGFISADLPTMIKDNNVYVSLFHFLRYMGIEYSLNENPPIQLSIYKRYDIYDALGEYFKFENGNMFSWNEIDIENETADWYETEQERVEAEIIGDGVIALMNRDPNIFRWIINPEGIEQEAIEDALLEIIKTECSAEIVEETNANQIVQMGKSIIGTGSDWYTIFAENYKNAHNDIPKIGKQIDDLGGLLNNVSILGVNVFVAFDALREYDNLSNIQKDLLENTIIKYFEEPRILKQEWESSYGVAKELNKKIQDTYMANYKAADKAGTSVAYDYINAAAGVSNPVSAYIECMDLLANIIPKFRDNISNKERIYNAYNCYMYQNLANYIFGRWYNDFYYHNNYNYNLEKNSSYSFDIKNALILQTKASIATRASLMQSNCLTDDLLNHFMTINKEMEQFLNKVEGCKTEGLINTSTNYDNDLSWMLNYTDHATPRYNYLLSQYGRADTEIETKGYAGDSESYLDATEVDNLGIVYHQILDVDNNGTLDLFYVTLMDYDGHLELEYDLERFKPGDSVGDSSSGALYIGIIEKQRQYLYFANNYLVSIDEHDDSHDIDSSGSVDEWLLYNVIENNTWVHHNTLTIEDFSKSRSYFEREVVDISKDFRRPEYQKPEAVCYQAKAEGFDYDYNNPLYANGFTLSSYKYDLLLPSEEECCDKLYEITNKFAGDGIKKLEPVSWEERWQTSFFPGEDIINEYVMIEITSSPSEKISSSQTMSNVKIHITATDQTD